MHIGDVIISLKPQHADNILSGAKQIELRTRKMNIAPRTRIWLYATQPIAKIVGSVQLTKIISTNPSALWQDWGHLSGISSSEYFQYFSDRSVAHGLIIENPQRLRTGITLAELREADANFVPPQFFMRLDSSRMAITSLLGTNNQ